MEPNCTAAELDGAQFSAGSSPLNEGNKAAPRRHTTRPNQEIRRHAGHLKAIPPSRGRVAHQRGQS